MIRSRSWPRLLWPCLFATLACCSSSAPQHTILAPRPLPTPRTGQGMTGIIEAGVQAGAVVERSDPTLANPDAGITLPELQGRVDVRFETRGIPGLDLGFIHERGLPYYARGLGDESPEIERSASSAGIAVHYVKEFSDAFHMGFGLDSQLFLVPEVHYRECIDSECPSPLVVEDEGRSLLPVFGLSLTPSYQLPVGFAIFWGVTVRNHPSIPRTGEARVEVGPFAAVTTIGASYTHGGSGLRGAVHVYRVFRDDPVRYPMAMAATLSIPLFRESDRQTGPRSPSIAAADPGRWP